MLILLLNIVTLPFVLSIVYGKRMEIWVIQALIIKMGTLLSSENFVCCHFWQPGVKTDEIDEAVHEMIIDNGAYPSPLGYGGFPKSVCTSVNECICHGIPDSRALEVHFLST